MWMWLGVIILKRNLKYILKEVQCKYLCNTKVPSNTKDKIYMNFLFFFLQMRQSGGRQTGRLAQTLQRDLVTRLALDQRFLTTRSGCFWCPMFQRDRTLERDYLQKVTPPGSSVTSEKTKNGCRFCVTNWASFSTNNFSRWQIIWSSWNWQIIISGNSKVKKQHQFVNL